MRSLSANISLIISYIFYYAKESFKILSNISREYKFNGLLIDHHRFIMLDCDCWGHKELIFESLANDENVNGNNIIRISI